MQGDLDGALAVLLRVNAQHVRFEAASGSVALLACCAAHTWCMRSNRSSGQKARWLCMDAGTPNALRGSLNCFEPCTGISTVRAMLQGQTKDEGTAAAEQELLMLWSAVEQDRSPRSHAFASPEVTAGAASLELANPFAAAATAARQQPAPHKAVPVEKHDGSHAVVHHHDGYSRDSDVLQVATAGASKPLDAGTASGHQRAAPPAHDTDQLPRSGVCSPQMGLQCEEPRRSVLASLWHRVVRPAPAPQPLGATQAVLKEQSRYETQQPFAATLVMVLRDIGKLFRGHERRAALVAMWLAVFNQIGASTSIINYAPQVLEVSGVKRDEKAILMSSLISLAKAAGVVIGACCAGAVLRRPALIAAGAARHAGCIVYQGTHCHETMQQTLATAQVVMVDLQACCSWTEVAGGRSCSVAAPCARLPCLACPWRCMRKQPCLWRCACASTSSRSQAPGRASFGWWCQRSSA